ncbi:CotO family spore coat protein [Metabacillus halosaccharovorans]|uniref:CotO family spore coat protein n=1 Tax=Metabacillus halosaccharovorans TaxID=930124 RepID=UPI00203EA481|nr:CotO family spore coat protein [Metabacillus halosaccharovorans]MCM3442359.1 spore coat CotO family protein [Metabacillus halosaccharovorans]
MANKQNYKMKPLMYIVQPDSDGVHVNMQSYVVKKAKQKVVEKPKQSEVVVNTVVEEAVETELQGAVSTAVEIQEEEQVEEEPTVKQYRKQRKPITQMNVQEKVEFFKHLPKNMPRTLCQIRTVEETYRGVIMTEENDIVTIRSLTHSKPIDIPLNQIKEINLLGF